MDLASQILALSVHNTHDHTSFRLQQISAISRKWTVLPLHFNSPSLGSEQHGKGERRVIRHSDKDGGHYRVEPGQTKTFIFRLVPREDPSNDHPIGTSLIFVRRPELATTALN